MSANKQNKNQTKIMCVCACTRRYEYVHVRCMCCMCTSVRSKAMGVAAQSVIEVLRARLSVPTETETQSQTGLLRAESTSAPCSFPHFYPFQRKSLPTVYSLPPFRRFFVPSFRSLLLSRLQLEVADWLWLTSYTLSIVAKQISNATIDPLRPIRQTLF